jgi:hypothetical protein
MMTEAYRRYDGQALVHTRLESAVVREERKLVISKLHQKPTTKMPMFLSPIL